MKNRQNDYYHHIPVDAKLYAESDFEVKSSIYPYAISCKSILKFWVGGFRKLFHHWKFQSEIRKSFNMFPTKIRLNRLCMVKNQFFYLRKSRKLKLVRSELFLKKFSTVTYLGISTKFYSQTLPPRWWPEFVGTPLVHHKIIVRAARHS